MLFSEHRVLDPTAASAFTGMSENGMVAPSYSHGAYELFNTTVTPVSGQSISYHTSKEFYAMPKPEDPHIDYCDGVKFFPADPSAKPVLDPFPGKVDIDELGSFLNLSGRILGDGLTIAVSFDARLQVSAGFQYAQDASTELPVFIEGNYAAEVQMESGGMLILPADLHEQTRSRSYPLVGTLLSKKHHEQWYKVLAIYVEIVNR